MDLKGVLAILGVLISAISLAVSAAQLSRAARLRDQIPKELQVAAALADEDLRSHLVRLTERRAADLARLMALRERPWALRPHYGFVLLGVVCYGAGVGLFALRGGDLGETTLGLPKDGPLLSGATPLAVMNEILYVAPLPLFSAFLFLAGVSLLLKATTMQEVHDSAVFPHLPTKTQKWLVTCIAYTEDLAELTNRASLNRAYAERWGDERDRASTPEQAPEETTLAGDGGS